MALFSHEQGLTPRAVLARLAGVQMLDVELPTTDGRWLVLSRYTQPETAVALVLGRLRMKLPCENYRPSIESWVHTRAEALYYELALASVFIAVIREVTQLGGGF
jgi:hypothetical protein